MAERDLPCWCSHDRCSVTSALTWNESSPAPPPSPKFTSTWRVKKSTVPNPRGGLPETGRSKSTCPCRSAPVRGLVRVPRPHPRACADGFSEHATEHSREQPPEHRGRLRFRRVTRI